MEQLKLFRVLMTPSPLSLVLTILAAILYVTRIAWVYLGDNPVIYNYLKGPDGLSMYVWQGTEPLITWFTRFSSSSIGYYVFLIAIGLFIGLIAFTLIQVVSHIFRDTSHFVDDAEVATRSRLIEMFAQLWLRCIALIGLVFFVSMTLTTFMPMVNMFIDIGASYLRGFDMRGVLPFAVALLVCAGTIHMNLVFVRLLLLRPRILSKWEEL